MDKLLRVSPSPHVRDSRSTTGIMGDVLIALVPAGAVGVYMFGLKALLLIAVGMVSAVAAEALFQKAAKRKVTVCDLSAAVTGLLIAYNVPVTAEWWQVMIGSVFAIVIVKQLFGGIGMNIVNPALAARAVLQSSWATSMNTFTEIQINGVDGLSGATPLAVLHKGAHVETSVVDMLIGRVGGCIGEVSAIALIIGAIYLVVRGVIKLHVPASYIGTVAVISAVYAAFVGKADILNYVAIQLLGGGLMLGALFMATDYVTNPMTAKGQIIFGVGAGVLTSVIRIWGGYPEGVSYSILLMNIATPIIDKFTAPRIYGSEVKKSA